MSGTGGSALRPADQVRRGLRSAVLSGLPRMLSARLRAMTRALTSRHFVDEVEIIANLTDYLPVASEPVLVDVGAHYGRVSERYLRMGWSVVAYEPDPANRLELQQRIGSHPRLQVSAAAVSDQPVQTAPLFTSPVSAGISSLSAFHETHRAATVVEVVTLEDDLAARGITRVDFLKVDAEGFDYFALRGFDWTAYTPRFVLYEFEDRKTVRLGHSLAESSAYVARLGYHLVYSVWEPIVQYGTRHQWRGLFTALPPDVAACWGNVLCFRDEADASRCRRNRVLS